MANEDEKSNSDNTAVAESQTLKIRLEQAKSSAPTLVVISGKPLGKSFFLTKPVMVLGRDLTADISIGETSISRRHTEFNVSEQGIFCKDLGSTNGTFINDQRCGNQQLVDGDLIRCGNTILKFLKEGKIENLHYEKMYELANRDALTQALNRKAIMELIAEEHERSSARSLPLTLLMLDIDHFKTINDTYGHPAGDHVLKETCALILNKMIRSQDVLGRYGGEEFALLLRETKLPIAIDVAERIRAAIEKQVYTFDNKQIPVTISIGVASLDSTSKSADDLIATADRALYDAKNQGRNRVCVR
ncbi:diguanylate cyclase [bacterium]|nr:diguanylate cyclase [bacterium]